MLIRQVSPERIEKILHRLRFQYIPPYRVAGMAEPWSMEVEETLKVLAWKGVGAILTLTEDNLYGDKYLEAGFEYHYEPIDDCEPPTFSAMERAVDFIDASIYKGLGVAVHCLEGRGRTGTVLAGWLGLKENLSPEDAISRIYEARVHTIITPSQREFIKRYLQSKF